MTAASNEVVAVIQADVDAANALDDALGFLTDNERPIVLQALARHRIAHSDPRPVAEGLREAAHLAAWNAIYGRGADPFQNPESFDFCGKVADAVLATHSPAPMAGEMEREALERAIDRMGWAEIHAYQAELRKGQDTYEDAGGYFLRAIRALFGIKQTDTITTYQDAARALVAAAHPSTQGGADRG